MRSGDRPGLQNRRVAGFPVAGGFDSHSLPPFFIYVAARQPAKENPAARSQFSRYDFSETGAGTADWDHGSSDKSFLEKHADELCADT